MLRALLSFLALSTVAACGSGSLPSDPDEEAQQREERQQREAEAVESLRDSIDAGLWTGTVTINETASGDIAGPSAPFSSETTSVTLEHRVTLTVNGSSVGAHVTYALTESTESHVDYDQHTLDGKVDKKTAADGGTVGTVDVAFYDDGAYAINYSVEGISGTYVMEETSFSRCKPDATSCRDFSGSNSDSAEPSGLGYMSGSVQGPRGDRDRLSGSQTEEVAFVDMLPARRVVTWDLRR